MTPSRARLASTWLATTAVVAVVAALVGPEATGRWSDAGFEELLARVCAVALLLCAAWAWLVTTLVVVEAGRGARRATPGVPDWARRVVLAACGVAVLGAAGAGAAGAVGVAVGPDAGRPEVGTGRPDPPAVSGLPLPDRATGGMPRPAAPARPAPPAPPPAAGDPGAAVVVVRPGDSLWSIAAATLPPASDDTAVAARTHWLHEHNRAVIGADPDLIRPGHELRTPPDARPAR